MANEQHPIAPSPELRRQWLDNDHFPMVTGTHDLLSITRDRLNSVIDQATQWGADQELEACVEWLRQSNSDWEIPRSLHAARRPKPPSLKEQALKQLDGIATCFRATHMGDLVCDKIRRALEALPDDQF